MANASIALNAIELATYRNAYNESVAVSPQ
jgi:hypothetical protein